MERLSTELRYSGSSCCSCRDGASFKITRREDVLLQDGDLIRFGDFPQTFRLITRAVQAGAAESPQVRKQVRTEGSDSGLTGMALKQAAADGPTPLRRERKQRSSEGAQKAKEKKSPRGSDTWKVRAKKWIGRGRR
eukprot:768405-Hanusia_phi.AAC.2